MSTRRDGHIKAAGLLLALEKNDPGKFAANDLSWKFTTGRLPTRKEWELMRYFNTTKLSDAFSELRHGWQYYEGLVSASLEELIQKGWITKKDIAMARSIAVTQLS